MPNVFRDHNQHFIDISEEDDYLLSFHSLEDVRVSDNCMSRRRSLLRKSLGWDNALITSEGLLNPEELVKVNKGFKKLNPTTQKDAKISTKIAGAFKKMNICSRNKDTVTSHVKLFSSRQANNNAAVGRSDNNGVKVVNKTRKVQDSKMSSTCFTSPTVQKTVHRPCESPYTAKRSAKIVGCNSCKKINVCFQNKKQDTVTRLPKLQTNNNAAVERSDNGVKIENKTKKGAVHDSKRSPSCGLPKLTCFTSPTIQKTVNHSYEPSSSKNLSIKGKVNPKNTTLVNSPTSVFRFPLSPSSTSPPSFVEGESLFSSGPKRNIKSSGLCTPSPKVGFFDSISKDQSNLSPCVSTRNSLMSGKNLSRKADARKVGSNYSKSKPDGQIPKEILKNRMMSIDQKSQKDEVNDLSRQSEAIDLESDAVEVKGQQMHSSFKDDNLQLIDCSGEDDYLIPFPYRDSLEDLRLSATFDNAHGDVRSKPRRRSLLRKSLAWDSAFFTSAGLLNPEELFILNEGFKKSKPTSPKDAKRSKVATKIGGNQSNGFFSACKKMNNAAAVKGSDNAKMENKTGTAHDSKRSRSGGLPRLTCFTSPTIQKAIKASGLRMPSPRIGFFDMEPGSVHDFFRFNERQLQSSNLSRVSGKVGKTGKKKCVNLSGPTRDRLRKMLSFDVEFYD